MYVCDVCDVHVSLRVSEELTYTENVEVKALIDTLGDQLVRKTVKPDVSGQAQIPAIPALHTHTNERDDHTNHHRFDLPPKERAAKGFAPLRFKISPRQLATSSLSPQRLFGTGCRATS